MLNVLGQINSTIPYNTLKNVKTVKTVAIVKGIFLLTF